MINKELIKEIKKIDFKKYNGQHIDNGLEHVKKKDIIIYEGGGGWSTELCLLHVAKNGGKVVTIDLCSKPKHAVFLGEELVGLAGDGDYTDKEELYKSLQNNKIISKYFEWYNEDIYGYFERTKPTIDFYFDDATHYSGYLIPLFEMLMPMFNKGAITGSHDMGDGHMTLFAKWMHENKDILEIERKNSSGIFKVKRK